MPTRGLFSHCGRRLCRLKSSFTGRSGYLQPSLHLRLTIQKIGFHRPSKNKERSPDLLYFVLFQNNYLSFFTRKRFKEQLCQENICIEFIPLTRKRTKHTLIQTQLVMKNKVKPWAAINSGIWMSELSFQIKFSFYFLRITQ